MTVYVVYSLQVPGVPVYLAGGVIIVKSAMQKFSFGLAVAYGIVVCWLIKVGV